MQWKENEINLHGPFHLMAAVGFSKRVFWSDHWLIAI
uniref:Uncharacterized protein n=1 Tax=Rhizophora mucronata TaxID=61149 RepID=A0A2P2JCW4_RHIMU